MYELMFIIVEEADAYIQLLGFEVFRSVITSCITHSKQYPGLHSVE